MVDVPFASGFGFRAYRVYRVLGLLGLGLVEVMWWTYLLRQALGLWFRV